MYNGPSTNGSCPSVTGYGRPFIGVCAAVDRARWSFWDQDATLVADTYLKAVRRGGGVSVILVPEEDRPGLKEALMDRIDGLLLVGGPDIEPTSYGAVQARGTERTVPLRDRFELSLVRAALQRDLPVLGICRGLQVLNVATGGTLHQDLTDQGFWEHRAAPGRLDDLTEHEVEVEPDSVFAGAAQSPRQTVNSHHHQGIAQIGDGGRVTARSVPDGVVEALEWPAQRYAVGVQWHPEAMERDITIAGFVRAAALKVKNSYFSSAA